MEVSFTSKFFRDYSDIYDMMDEYINKIRNSNPTANISIIYDKLASMKCEKEKFESENYAPMQIGVCSVMIDSISKKLETLEEDAKMPYESHNKMVENFLNKLAKIYPQEDDKI